MKFHWTILVCLTLACGASRATAAEEDGVRELLKAKRVVFLGDSITYSGQYIAYLETYLTTRFPEQRFEFIDIGLPSETCSGLSEPGHAGGAFPRPDVHERLARVLDKLKPNLIVACYGMNCGMYHPLNDERLQKYQDGMQRLRDAASKAGAKVLHLTPPTFDAVPLKGRTLPAGRESYSQPYEGYNEVLGRFSEWLLAQRSQGWSVVDIHGPMDQHLAERRKTQPTFVLAGDGVHAGPTGHWLMTQQVLAALKLPADAGSLKIDAAAGKVVAGENASVKKNADGSLSIEWTSHLPMPVVPQWDTESLALLKSQESLNQYRLTVSGLTAANYELLEGDKVLLTASAVELQKGIDLIALKLLSTNTRAAELLGLITQRQRVLTDSWLNDVGHKRPGMSKGLPVAEATTQAESLSERISKAAKPAAISLKLMPK